MVGSDCWCPWCLSVNGTLLLSPPCPFQFSGSRSLAWDVAGLFSAPLLTVQHLFTWYRKLSWWLMHTLNKGESCTINILPDRKDTNRFCPGSRSCAKRDMKYESCFGSKTAIKQPLEPVCTRKRAGAHPQLDHTRAHPRGRPLTHSLAHARVEAAPRQHAILRDCPSLLRWKRVLLQVEKFSFLYCGLINWIFWIKGANARNKWIEERHVQFAQQAVMLTVWCGLLIKPFTFFLGIFLQN